MNPHQASHREAEIVREIELEADTARATIPQHLRSKRRPAPVGSTRLDFSHRPATPDTRKARP